MNAEQWNAMYPVGTLVFAYPGFRPEDDRNARRLVTRTRTKAQMSASGNPVVWVDGEGSYICLTHVDPVSESAWQAARAEETAAAVAAQGALPVPVGDQPQPLAEKLAEIRARAERRMERCQEKGQVSLAQLNFMKNGVLAAATIGAAALAEVEPLKAELAGAREDVAFLHRNTLPNLHRQIEHHQAGKRRWRDRAEKAEARVAELEAELAKYVGQEPTVAEEMAYLSRSVQAVADVCDKAEQQALRWEDPLPVPEWVGAIRQALELAPAPTQETAS